MPRRLSCELRSERGQTAAEYMGILLVVAAIIGTLFASGLAGQITAAARDMVTKVAGGGVQGGGGGGQNGGANGPNAGGGQGPSGGKPGSPGDHGAAATALATCFSSGKAYGYCLKTFDPARYFVETRPAAALKRVDDATQAILNSGARTGSPEFNQLVLARQKALDEYLTTKPTANRLILRALNNTKKLFDPRGLDIAALRDRFKSPATPSVARPNTASGGPKVASSASKVLRGASKFAKGLGIVGTAVGLVTNVQHDGVAKGVTETAGGLAGGVGLSTLAATGCAALAVTGVGAVACGAGVLVVGVVGSELGKRATGWVYDHALAPAGRAVKGVAVGAAKKVAEGGKKVLDGGKKVVSALNPFD